MYRLEFLPLARKDMVEIVRYISQELENPDAAERLTMKLIETTEKLSMFPYVGNAYHSLRPLKNEYRKISVKNYLMFYWVDEENKAIVVTRVLYMRRDYGRLLE
ncbi:type II toxin-antitoxin system RelE/ParE family toxin [[Clostridium] innocuum]|uniref:type II toxin-antitoxin system RelE/ParE family toxin n=1 Tax=Clostridium innocuum TaxID=1522 RepID=UPI003A4D323E